RGAVYVCGDRAAADASRSDQRGEARGGAAANRVPGPAQRPLRRLLASRPPGRGARRVEAGAEQEDRGGRGFQIRAPRCAESRIAGLTIMTIMTMVPAVLVKIHMDFYVQWHFSRVGMET